MESQASELSNLRIAEVRPNPLQPRKRFESAPLRELADSIASLGVMEPIVVRPLETGFIIVAGERRWRAAGMAGLETIPAVIRRDLDDRAAAILAMVENVMRKDLNPIEEASGYQTLLDAGLTVDELAAQTGKGLQSIRSYLTLLKLDVPIQDLVEKGHLTCWDGMRLATLSINSQHRALRLINEHGLVGNDRDRVIGQLWVAEHQEVMFGEAVEADPEKQKRSWDFRERIERAALELAKASELADEGADVEERTIELAELLVRQAQAVVRVTRAARTARLVSEQLAVA